jgi:predicted amidohydrolase
VASYRKIHLFDVDVPNGPVLLESRTTAPGSKVIHGLSGCTHIRDISQSSSWCIQASALSIHLSTQQRPSGVFGLRITSHHITSHHITSHHTTSQAEVCDSPVGRLGLSICYDLRFPELYQHLAWDLGAQVRECVLYVE